MDKIKTIVLKEWAEVFKNKMVLFTVIFMPLMFTALPLAILQFSGNEGVSDMNSEMPSQFAAICPENLTGGECFQVFIVSQFMLLFMMLPLIIPVNIAAYSVVGEKTTRSLEPLLATPITTAELLTGKNLAATIPAVGATLGSFLVFALGAGLIANSPNVTGALLNPMWLLAVFVVGPLLAVLSVNFAIIISSRVNDPRVAEQMSAIVVVPILAIFFGQMSGLFFINSQLVIIFAAILLLIDIGIVYLAVRLFQRETILTRWK